jgi:ubiquinone/menaquinone biosynthesis C-methylase UbiE
MLAKAKVETMVLLNMRYELIMVDKNLTTHPNILVENILSDCLNHLKAWEAISFIESPERNEVGQGKGEMELRHQDLFQQLWVRFSEKDYGERIARYEHRLKVNDLDNGFFTGKRCIDLGCGHGNFAHALLKAGASYILGIDYGEASIQYAMAAQKRLGVNETQLQFKVGSVYALPEPDESYDIALQNGVFHHLDYEEKAYREAVRVLKKGGWMWIYTDGAQAISHQLWDVSLRILAKVPTKFVLKQLSNLNLETGKNYHLGDGLNAIYHHDTWAGLTARLAQYGFGNFKHLVGGFPTDFDHGTIESHNYGKEKFGEGEHRLLAQRIF